MGVSRDAIAFVIYARLSLRLEAAAWAARLDGDLPAAALCEATADRAWERAEAARLRRTRGDA